MKALVGVAVIGMLVLSSLFLVDPLLLWEVNQNREHLFVSPSIGFSMYPNIQTGDLLLILEKGSPNFNPQVGDILVFWYEIHTGEHIAVAHRIYTIQHDVFHVKGDYNTGVSEQEQVPMERVIGVVFAVTPRNPVGKHLYSALLN